MFIKLCWIRVGRDGHCANIDKRLYYKPKALRMALLNMAFIAKHVYVAQRYYKIVLCVRSKTNFWTQIFPAGTLWLIRNNATNTTRPSPLSGYRQNVPTLFHQILTKPSKYFNIQIPSCLSLRWSKSLPTTYW